MKNKIKKSAAKCDGGILAQIFVAITILCGFSAIAAEVTTDKSDYPPLSTAWITGTGFASSETVELQVLRIDIDENSGDAHLPWQVVADAAGNFQSSWFVNEDELGATLRLTAVGLTSGLIAQHTFTDGVKITNVIVGAQSGTPTYGTSSSATYAVTAQVEGGAGTVAWFVASLPSGVTAVFNPTSSDKSKDHTWVTTLTLTTATGTPPGAHVFEVIGQDDTSYTRITNSPTLTIIGKSISITGVAASGKTYDGTTVATLTGGSASGVQAGDIVTVIPGSGAFANKNVGLQGVTASGYSLGGADAGKYALAGQPSIPAATIAPAVLSYTANSATRVYGTANPAFSGTVSGFVSGENQANATIGTLLFTSSATVASVVGNYAINGSGLTANNGNYTFAQASGNASALSITKASTAVAATSTSLTPLTGSSVTLTATVTPVTASGTVVFKANNTTLGSGTLSLGVASITTPSIPHGSNTITAEYSGDANFSTSTNTLGSSIVVNIPPTAGTNSITRKPGTSSYKFAFSELLSSGGDADGDALTISAVGTSAQGVTVQRSGNWVFYVPTTAVTNNDFFTYTVSDGFGGVATGTVNLNILAVVQQRQLTSAAPGSGTFHGILNTTYNVEFRNELTDPWQFLVSVTTDANGRGSYVDATNPMPPQRFYRIVYP